MSTERRYRIQEVLGRGSFGVVYRADLLGAGGFAKPVAIKVLKSTAFPQAEIEQRLRDEARMLGLLRHPSVVRVDGLARLGDGWAVVMEYIAGVDGGELIRAGNVPPRAALEIAEQVAGALHAAWAVPSELTGEPLRIIHRDLKPSNVRITAHGEVKILDFGAARGDFAGRESSTQAWRFGTPRYMSPERHDGVEGPEGDVYAVGLLLAQLLGATQEGEPPTHPERHARFLEDLGAQIIERLAVRHPELPEERRRSIAALVEHLLAFEPRDRPDARAAQQQLRAQASGLPGPGLRAWAEDAVPAVELRLPPYTNDERCGLVVLEGGPMPNASSPRGVEDTLGVEIEVEVDTKAIAPAPASWRRATGGLALALALVAAVSFALLPARDLVPSTYPSSGPMPDAEIALPDDTPRADTPEISAPPAALTPVAYTPPPAPPRPANAKPAPPAAPDEAAPSAVEPPAPPAPPHAVVTLAGGAHELRLATGDQRLPPGDVPPGTYTVEVRFDGALDFVPAGRVTLGADEQVRIVCNANLLRCRKESP